MAEKTLQSMAAGGVYDHVGGGFHRYSVDEYWHVPHFEKVSLLLPLMVRVRLWCLWHAILISSYTRYQRRLHLMLTCLLQWRLELPVEMGRVKFPLRGTFSGCLLPRT